MNGYLWARAMGMPVTITTFHCEFQHLEKLAQQVQRSAFLLFLAASVVNVFEFFAILCGILSVGFLNLLWLNLPNEPLFGLDGAAVELNSVWSKK